MPSACSASRPGALALAGTGDEDEVADVPDRGPGGDELVEPNGVPAEGSDPRSHSLGFGNAVHAALEWSARHGWSEPTDALLGSLPSGAGAGGEGEIDRARALVRGWLDSELLASLEGAEVRAEVPFALPLAGIVVRGKIDLLARTERGVVLVDFKSDALHGGAAAELADRYRAQRELYALVAAGEAESSAAPVRAIHLFLEAPGEPVIQELGPLELEAARGRLEGLIDRIRDGDFVPTETPSAAICFGCPAAWNLCPHPAWRPRGWSTLAVFAYGSLASPASAAITLGRNVDVVQVARLHGWRRRWSLYRDNLAVEKTFSRASDGSLPAYCLGLNVEAADQRRPGAERRADSSEGPTSSAWISASSATTEWT